MSVEKLIITPKTKVGELLDAYPQLEVVLLELSPAFAKLKNPILRKTVARVASLQQAAIVGNIKVDELVNKLRNEVGQGSFTGETAEEGNYIVETPPEWFNPAKVSRQYDAVPVINSGGSPMSEILKEVHDLKAGEILKLKTPFVPAPIIDILKKQGCKLFSQKRDDETIYTYIMK